MGYANVEYHLRLDEIEAKLKAAIPIAIRLMMEDIKLKADPVTPKRYGVLRGSVSKTMLSNNHGLIRWNMPYAGVQEVGGRTDPRTGKWIPFVNYTTPGTGSKFVEQAVEQVKANSAEYIRKAGFI